METTVWYLDPRFLGPAITSLVSLLIAVGTAIRQSRKDNIEIDLSQAKTAIEIAQEVREQLASERAKAELLETKVKTREQESEKNTLRLLALEARVEFLISCVNTLSAQLRKAGIEPECHSQGVKDF